MPDSITFHHRYGSFEKVESNQTQRHHQSNEVTADPYQQSQYSGFNNFPSLNTSLMKIQNNNLSARMQSHERSQTAEGFLKKRETIKIFVENKHKINNSSFRQVNETQPILYTSASINTNSKTDRFESQKQNPGQTNLNSPTGMVKRDSSLSLWQD